MNKHLRFIFLLLLVVNIGLNRVFAQTTQTDFASEQEFKKEADRLYEAEEYEKAYPLYSQLVSLYRKDPNYNYRLGVCMLFAGDDKERAITFLEFAVRSSEVEKERFFYLAKAYHLNYRFDDAIIKYKVYKKIASSAKADRLQVDRQIKMCENGKSLLKTISDLTVIDKKEMSRADFFRSYDITGIGGKLLVKPDEKEFRTSLDKKKKENSIVYLAPNGNQIYFSSYGDNEQHGKDIFEMKKLPNGEWSKPQTLGKTINTDFDEDYPFLHPNGKVLYFSSKGHNSMGGYDIFKSIHNEETNTWSEPVNMDFPVNTPDDDILYVTDMDETKAYFSSARASIAGKIAVYHITAERKAFLVAYIKGNFIKNHKRQKDDAKITVKNMSDNSVLGVYNAKPNTGEYNIKLPNGGRFLFTVEAPDFTTQSEIVEIPVQNKFKPLKQEISFDAETDKLIIKTFDEAINDTTYLLALNFIKEKAKLDAGIVTEVAMEAPSVENPTAEENAVLAETTASTVKTTAKLSNDDIVKIAFKDAEEAEVEAKDSREQADIALDLANQKNEQAKAKSVEASALMAAAAKTPDNIKKQALTDEANAVNKDAEQLNRETVVTYNLAKKLDMTAASKQEESDLSQQYAKGLEAAVKSDNSAEALVKLADQEKKLDSLSQANADRFPVLASFKKEEDFKKRELDKTFQLSNDLKGEMADNETIIKNLKIDAEKTKSAQEKQGMNNQVAELIAENTTKQNALEQNEIKKLKLQKEYNNLRSESELASTVVDQSKTATRETTAARVASIDKNKLEEQVAIIKTTTPESTEIVSVSSLSDNKANEAPAVASSGTAAPGTTAKNLTDINKKYESELASAEKIGDADNRERERAIVYKDWSAAIDADVVKQKDDLAKTSDPEMKALLSKKIKDAESSSKDKQKQSYQSLTKIKPGDQKIIASNKGVAKTPVKAPAYRDPEDSVAVVSNTAEAETINENKNELLTKEYAYTASADEEITNANLANKEANDLVAQSDVLKSEAAKEKNPETKKEKLKRSEEFVKQSNEKRSIAAKQVATVNKTEFQNNKKQLEQFTETYSDNTEDEISMAEMNNDEAKIYFEKADKLRVQAEKSDSYSSKEVLTENAYKNEMIALAKQKRAVDIYKNFKPSPAIASSRRATGSGVKNTRTATTSKSSNLYSSATTPQIVKADSLDKQAIDLVERSVDLKFKAVEQKGDTNAQKAMVAQSEELIKQANEKKMQSSQLVAGANKTEYTTNKGKLDQLAQTSSTNNSSELLKAKAMNDEADQYFEKAQKKRTEAASADSFNSKEAALDEANKNEIIALQKQNESIDIYNKNNPAFIAGILKTNEGSAVSEANPNSNLSPSLNSIRPAITELFEQKSGAVYSKKHPIPINEVLPEGLVFKVQVGAFRKPIPQNLFKGMTPLMGETTPMGFIRYTAGLFSKYNSAYKVKDKIIELGFKDAFVVAFLNGKRIPINQAYAMDAGVPQTILHVNNLASSYTAVGVGTVPTTAPKAQSVSTISGLFYTVQVGVFAQKVSPAKLYNMDPLYSEAAPNGNLRYYTGAYKSVSRANEARGMVVDVGIKDAFVTAYYNGKRISKAEALKYEEQGDGVFATLPNMNKLPTFKANSKQKPVVNSPVIEAPKTNTLIANPIGVEAQQVNKPVTTEPVAPTVSLPEAAAMPIDSGIVFKLQIGAFNEEVPLSIANKYIKIASRGIKNYKDKAGLTIYTVGNFRTYTDAEQLKSEVMAADITDTFIVAYRNGEKISIDEAKKLTGK